MYDTICLELPGKNFNLHQGNRVRLGRFETTVWKVCFGWYSWGGNRPVCGWYLVDNDDPGNVKPLQLPDLDDIFLVETYDYYRR